MQGFLRHLRDTFISGLLAIIPVGGTIFLIWFLYDLIDGLVGKTTPFGKTVETVLGQWIPGMGIYMTVILILIIGFVMRNFFGRYLHYYLERIVFSIPGVRKMYFTLKQFSSALLTRDTSSFKQVVIFEYPKEGINIVGLITNESPGKLQQATDEECAIVYAPTAPNPLSGMMLIIPKNKLTYVDIPVDYALSMILSSGSVLPDSVLETEPKPRPRFHPFKHH